MELASCNPEYKSSLHPPPHKAVPHLFLLVVGVACWWGRSRCSDCLQQTSRQGLAVYMASDKALSHTHHTQTHTPHTHVLLVLFDCFVHRLLRIQGDDSLSGVPAVAVINNLNGSGLQRV